MHHFRVWNWRWLWSWHPWSVGRTAQFQVHAPIFRFVQASGTYLVIFHGNFKSVPCIGMVCVDTLALITSIACTKSVWMCNTFLVVVALPDFNNCVISLVNGVIRPESLRCPLNHECTWRLIKLTKGIIRLVPLTCPLHQEWTFSLTSISTIRLASCRLCLL